MNQGMSAFTFIDPANGTDSQAYARPNVNGPRVTTSLPPPMPEETALTPLAVEGDAASTCSPGLGLRKKAGTPLPPPPPPRWAGVAPATGPGSNTLPERLPVAARERIALALAVTLVGVTSRAGEEVEVEGDGEACSVCVSLERSRSPVNGEAREGESSTADDGSTDVAVLVVSVMVVARRAGVTAGECKLVSLSAAANGSAAVWGASVGRGSEGRWWPGPSGLCAAGAAPPLPTPALKPPLGEPAWPGMGASVSAGPDREDAAPRLLAPPLALAAETRCWPGDPAREVRLVTDRSAAWAAPSTSSS